jgi:hypothetical protein
MIKLSEKLFGAIDWHALTLDLSPKCGDCYATHKGSLKVNAFEIKCYKASDGLEALDIEDIERFFRGCPNCNAPSDCRHCIAIKSRMMLRVKELPLSLNRKSKLRKDVASALDAVFRLRGQRRLTAKTA